MRPAGLNAAILCKSAPRCLHLYQSRRGRGSGSRGGNGPSRQQPHNRPARHPPASRRSESPGPLLGGQSWTGEHSRRGFIFRGKNRDVLFSRRPRADSSTPPRAPLPAAPAPAPLSETSAAGKGAAGSDKPCGKNQPKSWNRTEQRLTTNLAQHGHSLLLASP